MINRWIGIATLGLMLSVNAALLVRDFLPDWMAGEPPLTRALELRDGDEINIQFGLYGREGHRIGHSWTRTKRDRELVLVRHRTVIDSLYMYIWQFAVIIVLVAGGYMVINANLSLGKLVAFVYYAVYLVFPMFDISFIPL